MPEMQNMPIVVFGNKIDIKDAYQEEELRRELGLDFHLTYGKGNAPKNTNNRPIEVFMCSVKLRVGYSDGFEWLSDFIK